jgi:hypothetical protein
MGQMWGYKSWAKSDLASSLESDADFRTKYMFVIFCWEIRYINPSACPFGGHAQLPDFVLTTVVVVDENAFQTEEVLGNLWPPQVYEKRFMCKPPKKDLVRIRHRNVWVSGVVLEPCFGEPIGVIKLTQWSKQSVQKASHLANNAEDGREEQATEVFDVFSKKMGLTAAVQPKGEDAADSEPAIVAIKQACKTSGESCFDDIWQQVVKPDKEPKQQAAVQKKLAAALAPTPPSRSGTSAATQFSA